MFKTLSEWIEASKEATEKYVERMKAEDEARAKALTESKSPPKNDSE